MKDSGFDEMVASGFRGIDSEHQVQLELLEAFRRAEGPDRSEIEEILDRLVDFTKAHFASEQLLMRLYQYPQYQAHLVDHEQTLERLEKLRRVHLEGGRELALDAADELSDCIFGHIRTADRALGHFVVRLGVGV